jgi:RNA polymerase sigma-70 factor (ECF subfamily)
MGGETDESLIARFARGDQGAFELLYDRHELRTWHFIHRHVGNREIAEELMQEVWLQVARDAALYEPTARFKTWLLTIARNRSIDSIRARREHLSLESVGYDAEPVLEQLTANPGDGPLAAAITAEESALLSQALGQLPQQQREALLLQMEGELSVEEIAAISGEKFETIKSRLRYARAALRKLLDGHI